MKRNKVWVVILSFVLGLSVLAGCNVVSGGGSSNEIVVLLDNKDQAMYEQQIAAFNELYPQYVVKPVWTAGDDIQSSQATRFGTRQPLDVVVGGDMYTEVYRRNLLPLDELMARDAQTLDMDDIADGVMENLKTEDGKTVFLPRYFNVSFLYYNKNLFDADRTALLALNLSSPPAGTPDSQRHYPNENWTIEDFFKAGGVLTKIQGSNVSQWGAETLTSWWGEWLIHVRQSGGDLFDQNGNVTFDNEQCRNAMQIMRDKSYGNAVLSRPKISVAPGEGDLSGFQAQKTAMIYGGHTANWARYDSIAGLNWGLTVLPTGLSTRNGAEYAIEGFGISKNSKNVEGAWAFITYMTGVQAIQGMTDAGYIPIRTSVYEAMEAGAKKERVALAYEAINPNGKYGRYAMTLPKYEYFVEIANTVASAEIGLMMARENDSTRISIAQCCQNIQKKGNDLIELNYR